MTSSGDLVVGLIVLLAVSLIALAVLNWVLALLSSGRETPERIARERFARGEISTEELHLLLHAL